MKTAVGFIRSDPILDTFERQLIVITRRSDVGWERKGVSFSGSNNLNNSIGFY